MELGLKGKVAIITGGGRGIGRETALMFAREGCRVAATDIDLAAAEGVADEARSLGGNAKALKADVTNVGQVNDIVARVLDWAGRIDILVNNAGIAYGPGGPIVRSMFWETPPEKRDAEIQIVLIGVMNCARAVIEHMMAAKRGAIVNIASCAGEMGGLKRISVYGAAKGGVIAFTKLLASEAGPYVRVNAVSPGYVKTTRDMMAEQQKENNPKAYSYYKHNLDLAMKDLPLARAGEPGEIASAVLFLASDAASYVTGQTVSVNGGMFMR